MLELHEDVIRSEGDPGISLWAERHLLNRPRVRKKGRIFSSLLSFCDFILRATSF